MPFRRRAKTHFYTADESDDCGYDIVGESFRRDQIRTLLKTGKKHRRRYDGWTKLGVEFWLIPDPENAYDPNAVGVYADPDRKLLVGYIPAAAAKQMSKRITKPFQVDGVVIGKKGRYGVKLHRQTLKEAGLVR